MDKQMDTPEDIRVQERREGYNDDWYDAHDYQQFLIDQQRDEEMMSGPFRCEKCGSEKREVRYLIAYLNDDRPMECDGEFHGVIR